MKLEWLSLQIYCEDLNLMVVVMDPGKVTVEEQCLGLVRMDCRDVHAHHHPSLQNHYQLEQDLVMDEVKSLPQMFLQLWVAVQ